MQEKVACKPASSSSLIITEQSQIAINLSETAFSDYMEVLFARFVGYNQN